MRILPQTLLATAILGLSLGAAQSAQAVDISKIMHIDPATACQLSIPTTDTAVRPRATGYRNEGETSAFVICGMAYFTDVAGGATEFRVQMIAFDGLTHNNVSCTAVNRGSNGTGSVSVYSSKSVSVDPAGDLISWAPADLNNFGNLSNSVTCILPAGVAITGVRLVYPDDVGA